MLSRVFFCLIGYLIVHTGAAPITTPAADLNKKLARYVQQGSVLVADDHKVLYYSQADQLFVPASILKLATALAAIHYLGPDYRYKTEFYVNDRNDVTVRGYGDPHLVSEEWETIVAALSKQKALPQKIRNIYLDDSVFNSKLNIPGVEHSLNPYDARSGALVSNFNTIHVALDKKGKLRSAEQQTPLTPLARQLAKGLSPGKHRINISRHRGYILPYVGELFREFLKKSRYRVSGDIRRRPITKKDRLVYTHYNRRPLLETIQGMMLYSNNFTANQLLLTIGMETYGAPATLKKGVDAFQQFLQKTMKIPPAQFQVAEGSGISRKNKMTAQAMLTIVKAFRPYKSRLASHKKTLLKTGTLRGVYTMAGYLPHPTHNRYFVIMLNQKRNYRDKVLSLLAKEKF